MARQKHKPGHSDDCYGEKVSLGTLRSINGIGLSVSRKDCLSLCQSFCRSTKKTLDIIQKACIFKKVFYAKKIESKSLSELILIIAAET